MDFRVNASSRWLGRPRSTNQSVHPLASASRFIPKSEGFTWLYEAALPYCEAVFYRTGTIPRHQRATNGPGWPGASRAVEFHYGHPPYAMGCFLWGSGGDTAPPCGCRTCCISPPYLTELVLRKARRRTTSLCSVGITFQRSMYNVTSAVIQALAGAPRLAVPARRSRSLSHLQGESCLLRTQMTAFISVPRARLQDVPNRHYAKRLSPWANIIEPQGAPASSPPCVTVREKWRTHRLALRVLDRHGSVCSGGRAFAALPTRHRASTLVHRTHPAGSHPQIPM